MAAIAAGDTKEIYRLNQSSPSKRSCPTMSAVRSPKVATPAIAKVRKRLMIALPGTGRRSTALQRSRRAVQVRWATQRLQAS